MPRHLASVTNWLGRRGSNPRYLAPKASALPLGYIPEMAEAEGFEPPRLLRRLAVSNRTHYRSVKPPNWWQGKESNLRCSPLWVTGLQPAAIATMLPCHKNGPRRGSRTPNLPGLSRTPLPIGLHADDVVGLLGVEPRKCRVLSTVHMPVLLQAQFGGRDRDRTCLRVTAPVFKTSAPPLRLPFRIWTPAAVSIRTQLLCRQSPHPERQGKSWLPRHGSNVHLWL